MELVCSWGAQYLVSLCRYIPSTHETLAQPRTGTLNVSPIRYNTAAYQKLSDCEEPI